MASSSTNSPCAACKFLRRKCTPGCVFAPYFPPDQPAKFANVHRVFGASNVAKLLNELSSSQREDAVNSLAYEAEARIRDPVYGCVGYISVLQHRLKQLQQDLDDAKKELSSYIGSTALHGPFLAAAPAAQPSIPLVNLVRTFQEQQRHSAVGPPAVNLAISSPLGLVPCGMHSHAAAAAAGMGQLPHAGDSPSAPKLLHHQQYYHSQPIMEAQRLAAAAREHQEMFLRGYDQQQHDLLRYGGGVDGGSSWSGGAGSGGGFSYMSGVASVAGMPSSLAPSPHASDHNQLHNTQHHPYTPRAAASAAPATEPAIDTMARAVVESRRR